MKKILLLSFVMATSSAYANDSMCDVYSQMAGAIMETRQAGVAAKDVIGAADGDELLVTITQAAYKEPRWSSDDLKQQAVDEFQSRVYLDCYKKTK